MTGQANRYNTDDTATLVRRIRDLQKRLARLESNTHIGNTAIDTGSLIVREPATIALQDTAGQNVITMSHDQTLSPERPRIYLSPSGDDGDHKLFIDSADRLFDTTQQTFIQYVIKRSSDNEFDGGYIVAFETGGTVGYDEPAVGTSGDAYFQCRNEAVALPGFGLFQDQVRIVGRWINHTSGTHDVEDANYIGTLTTGAGNSATVTYPVTFSTTMYPIITTLDAVNLHSFTLTAQSSASFTVAWTGAAAAKTVNMWNIRM